MSLLLHGMQGEHKSEFLIPYLMLICFYFDVSVLVYTLEYKFLILHHEYICYETMDSQFEESRFMGCWYIIALIILDANGWVNMAPIEDTLT